MLEPDLDDALPLDAERIHVTTLGMRRGMPSLAGVSNLCRLLRSEKPQILHTWMYHANLMGLVAGKIAGVPTIVWAIRCSDMDFSKYSPLSRLVFKTNAVLSRWPDVIVFNSRVGLAVHSQRGFANPDMEFIPNGIETRRFHPDADAKASVRNELRCGTSDMLVGHFARFDPMKDHETFIRGARLIRQNVPTVRFLMAGSGATSTNAALMRMLTQADLRDCFSLLGVRSDIPRLMAALDLFCSTSSFGEGFSNVVGEAMASGVPCVVTNVGDSAEIVGDGGLVVPPGDSDAFARACVKMLLMPAEDRSRIGLNSTKRIRENFERQIVHEQYAALYQRLGTATLNGSN
jgi:glycosyltransferase involved in cell wall biosynthesis